LHKQSPAAAGKTGPEPSHDLQAALSFGHVLIRDELKYRMDLLADIPNLLAAVQAEHVRLQLPSQPDWIQPAVEYLKQRAVLCGACLETQANKLLIGLHEALSNSVVHGNLEVSSELKERDDDSFLQALAERSADSAYASRQVDIEFDYDGARCRWTLTDQGKGFDFEQVLSQPVDDPEALLRPSGRGILMMRALFDEVRYEAGGRRLITTLYKSGVERRQQPRSEAHIPLQLMPVEADGTIGWPEVSGAILSNVSRGGVALLQSAPVGSDRILLGIPSDKGEPVYIPAEVRRCRVLGEGLVELGCRFETSGTRLGGLVADPSLPSLQEAEQAVGSLLDQLEQQMEVHDERRKHQRAVYTERIDIVGETGEPSFGFARNLSKSGINFITTGPLSLETKTLSLPAGERGSVKVRCQVVRCLKILHGFYDVGARFIGLDR
jgi:anti-sigma regulatory factor (Ser/Thr protein kinase)